MKLKIYFTSDVHGYIYPTDYRDTEFKNQGYINIINNFDKDDNTIIIDGGDTIQGSPFTTYLSKQSFETHPLAQVLNEGGYDYYILGNHDFNYGENYLTKFISQFNGDCLAANVFYSDNPSLIKPYSVKILKNGLKVAILGVTTDFINIWENEKNIKNFNIDNTFNSVEKTISLLPEHDLLIGVYHGGFEYDLGTGQKLSDTSENIAYELCKSFPFDILLTGHQHQGIIDKYVNETYIAQTPANGEKFIEINVEFENNKILDISGELKEPSIEGHPELSLKLLAWETQVQTWLDQPIGFLDVELLPSDHLDMALNGCLLANFFNQVQIDKSDADISCTSMANSLKGFNKEVTVRDVVSTYVYPNTLVVKKVTGEILKKALERSASYFEVVGTSIKIPDDFLKPKVAHYNYDYFSNIDYVFDLNKPLGQRVTSIKYKGCEVKPEDTLTLVMNNYRASGTGGYEFYRSCETVDEILIDMSEIIINYFEKHDTVVVDKTKYLTIKAPK
jgi:2',3'-cyclic-nucleotide 2'-phosphodiesterase/3'-nucleotidase